MACVAQGVSRFGVTRAYCVSQYGGVSGKACDAVIPPRGVESRNRRQTNPSHVAARERDVLAIDRPQVHTKHT